MSDRRRQLAVLLRFFAAVIALMVATRLYADGSDPMVYTAAGAVAFAVVHWVLGFVANRVARRATDDVDTMGGPTIEKSPAQDEFLPLDRIQIKSRSSDDPSRKRRVLSD